MDNNRRRLLYRYVKEKARVILAFFVCAGIFASVFFLYRLPVEATGYGVLLCLVYLELTAAVDFYRYQKKHRFLQQKQNDIIYTNTLDLSTKDLRDEDYEALLTLLCTEKNRLEREFNEYQIGLRDYYDLWTHQTKVPLSAIRLMMDTQKDLDKTTLANELFKLEQYIEMALYYTRLDGGGDYVIKTQSLDTIVTHGLKKYSRLFIAKKLILDYKKVDICIATDGKWLSFLVEQILSNSVKYTPAGGKISIYGESLDDSFRLVIADTGIGIIESDIPRIFEKGYTGLNGRKDDKSTGIGLYLSKKIADNLNISIEVESKLNRGSRFILIFQNKNERLE